MSERTWRNKPRRPYGATAKSVLEAHKQNKGFNSTKLGELLGLHPAYVRKALSRNGKALSDRA